MTTRKPRLLLLVSFVSAFVAPPGFTAGDAVELDAQEGQRPALPRLPIYNGRPTRRVEGSTTIEGARGTVDLGSALQGDLVVHEIRIVNPSEAPWNLERVQMCSGCMLDGVTRTIGPGETGAIAFVVPTDALGGQKIDGTIRAETGAADPSKLAIDVRLEVDEFAELHPYRLWLKGKAGEPIEETAIVVPGEAYPFEITAIRTRKGVWIETQWHETQHEGRPAFAIDVRNTRDKPGPYQDVLFVQTDHPERPEFKIRVEGRIE